MSLLMSQNKGTSQSFSVLDETLLSKEDISEKQMNILNCIRIQNKVREISNNVTEDGFDPMKIERETLDKLGLLISRLKIMFEELELTEAVQQCEKAILSIGRLRVNLDTVQNNTSEIPDEEYMDYMYGVDYAIQGVYTFTIGTVAREL